MQAYMVYMIVDCFNTKTSYDIIKLYHDFTLQEQYQPIDCLFPRTKGNVTKT